MNSLHVKYFSLMKIRSSLRLCCLLTSVAMFVGCGADMGTSQLGDVDPSEELVEEGQPGDPIKLPPGGEV